jgi:zinc transport system permease protein
VSNVAEVLQLEFMQRALIAGLLVSVGCGIVGTYVVINRLVFISGAIAHAAYGGIGLGYFLRANPVLGAIAFSVGAALAMGVVQRRTRERTDTIIGMMWAIGMAIGIIFIDLTPGYAVDLMSYLFGSILTVPWSDLLIMLVLDAVLIVVVVAFYKELVAISFDETYASTVDVRVDAIYLLLFCMVALTVVMLMRVVGLILVIALLTIPAAIGGQFTANLKRMMLTSVALGILFTTVGLWLSYAFDLTSGATIILTCAAGFVLAMAGKWLMRSRAAMVEWRRS